MSPKHYAKILLKKLKTINLPIDLSEIAKVDNITIKEVSAEGFEGILLVECGAGVIGINKDIREPGRKRFTIAHEFGHYYIPDHLSDSRSSFYCTGNDTNTYNKKDGIEYEANEFAVELLMPEEIFKEKIKGGDLSYRLLSELSGLFSTSLTATAIRYIEYNREYAIVFSSNSEIKWFYKGDEFSYYITSGNLSKDSFAIEFFKGEELPKTFQSVPANAWLGSHCLNNKEIKELSIPLPYYNSVLSFLYVDFEESEEIEELNGYLRFR